MRSDIPAELLPAFVDLALKTKNSQVTSVVFKPSARFCPSDPDFAWMRKVVRKAIDPPAPRKPSADDRGGATATPSPSPSASASPDPEDAGKAEDAKDTCAYRPETAAP